MPRMNVRKGDKVRVISGKERGLEGRVMVAMPKEQKVLIEGANRIKKHTKITSSSRGTKQGGIVTQEAPLHVSNVQVVCPNCGKPARVGHTREPGSPGKRVCRRCGGEI